jgi:hypothetical protein
MLMEHENSHGFRPVFFAALAAFKLTTRALLALVCFFVLREASLSAEKISVWL